MNEAGLAVVAVPFDDEFVAGAEADEVAADDVLQAGQVLPLALDGEQQRVGPGFQGGGAGAEDQGARPVSSEKVASILRPMWAASCLA